MPIHDWTRVDAGIFHHFHLAWIDEIAGILNRKLLPRDYYALAEQVAGNINPDVLTLARPVTGSLATETSSSRSGIAVASRRPQRCVSMHERNWTFMLTRRRPSGSATVADTRSSQ